MRKLILPLLILSGLTACKKESTKAEDTPVKSDSVAAVSPETSSTETVNLKEYSVTQAADYLKNKDNDTLYVTNFFATWCGPCLAEIPHFKEKMEKLKAQRVKFTFIDIDEKSVWNTTVKDFAIKNNLQDHIVLLDNKKLDSAFFKNNFEKWDGGAIPYTVMKKEQKTEEILGGMSAEMLDQKLASFK